MYNKFSLQKPHQQYVAVHATTVDRGKLLVMLYDGLLKFLRTSAGALDRKNVRQFSKYLSKSQAIISELMVTLDYEKGGQIAKDLERLYDFMLFHLTEANMRKDKQKVMEVIEVLTPIAQAFKEIVEKGEYKKDLPSHSTESAPKAPEEPKQASTLDALPGKTLSISY